MQRPSGRREAQLPVHEYLMLPLRERVEYGRPVGRCKETGAGTAMQKTTQNNSRPDPAKHGSSATD